MTSRYEICLFRHGKVEFDSWRWVSATSFREHVDCYNSQPIQQKFSAPSSPRGFGVVVCSNLSRSTESAQMLFQRFDLSSPIFREAELPDFPPLSLKLPFFVWLIIARGIWRCGAARNCESHADFKRRAKAAAHDLAEIAYSNTSAAFVGHGLINMYIAQELSRLGFEGPATPSREYSAGTMYVLVES